MSLLNICLISFILSALIVALFGKEFIKLLRSINAGQNVSQFLEAHQVKQGIPTMGGILILLGMAVGLAGGMWLFMSYAEAMPNEMIGFKSLEESRLELLNHDPFWWSLGLILFFAILGFFDDYVYPKMGKKKGISWKPKILLQFAVALPFALIVSYSKVTGNGFLGDFTSWGYFIFHWVVIVWWANSLNLTDGLDGLAGGSGAIAIIGLLLLAGLSKNESLSIGNQLLGWSMAGACVGFLWWNAPKAQMFMGDLGSMAIGSCFAILSINADLTYQAFLIGGLFCIESLSVMIQIGSVKLRQGKRVFLSSPIHHHFEQLKWPEQTIVIRFWLFGLLLTLLALVIFSKI